MLQGDDPSPRFMNSVHGQSSKYCCIFREKVAQNTVCMVMDTSPMSTIVSSSEASAFNISPDSLLIGKIIARGSPGVTVYDADIRVGPRTAKVQLLSATCTDLACIMDNSALTLSLCACQVAVKRLHTGDASAAVEAAFVREIYILQLASASCQRVCRLLGCSRVEGDPCIVMSLYPSSTAKRLVEAGEVCRCFHMLAALCPYGAGPLFSSHLAHL